MSKEFPKKPKKGATILVEYKADGQNLYSFATALNVSRKGRVETFVRGGVPFMVDANMRVMTILDPVLQEAAQVVAAQNKGKVYDDVQEVREAIMAEAEKNSKKVA